MRARWKRAGRTWWGGSVIIVLRHSGMVRQHQTRNLEILRCAIAHRSSMLAHRPGMTALCTAAITSFTSRPSAPDIPGRIDAVAETNHHEFLRRHDHDALAEIAGCEKCVAGDAELHAPPRVGMLAAIGPEAGGVIGVERRGGAKIHPVLVQDTLVPDHAVIQIEQAELRPVPRARQHVGRALQRADTIELQRDAAHAERIEQFAPRERQRLLRAADGVAHDARQDLRGRARVMPALAQRRDHLRAHGVGGHVVLQEHPARSVEAGIGFVQIEARGHAHQVLDLDLAPRIVGAAPFRRSAPASRA